MNMLQSIVLVILIIVTINGWYLNKVHKHKIKELDKKIKELNM